ncbi:unnamed protein product, partial [Coregonus sp. 'balchen']
MIQMLWPQNGPALSNSSLSRSKSSVCRHSSSRDCQKCTGKSGHGREAMLLRAPPVQSLLRACGLRKRSSLNLGSRNEERTAGLSSKASSSPSLHCRSIPDRTVSMTPRATGQLVSAICCSRTRDTPCRHGIRAEMDKLMSSLKKEAAMRTVLSTGTSSWRRRHWWSAKFGAAFCSSRTELTTHFSSSRLSHMSIAVAQRPGSSSTRQAPALFAASALWIRAAAADSGCKSLYTISNIRSVRTPGTLVIGFFDISATT